MNAKSRTPKTGRRPKTSCTPTRRRGRRWSAEAAKRSHALDFDSSASTKSRPRASARPVKRAAPARPRRQGSLYQSAMAMLNFFAHRGGNHPSPHRKQILASARAELRRLYYRSYHS